MVMKQLALVLMVFSTACGGAVQVDDAEESGHVEASPEVAPAAEAPAALPRPYPNPPQRPLPQAYPDPACSSVPTTTAHDCAVTYVACDGMAPCDGGPLEAAPGYDVAVVLDPAASASFVLPSGQCARFTIMPHTQRAVDGMAMEGAASDCAVASNATAEAAQYSTVGGVRGWVRMEVAAIGDACPLSCAP